MNRVNEAEKNFRKGCNCCQAVFLAYADLFDMPEEQALMLASPFGAGIGKTRGTCGVITGMTMVMGLAKGYCRLDDTEAKQTTYAMIQNMISDFTNKYETVICLELLGLKEGEDLPEPAVRDEAYYQSRPCLSLIKSACEIIDKNL